MKFGVGIPNCRQGHHYPVGLAGAKEIVQLSQMAERLGFDSLWADDHMTPTAVRHSKDERFPDYFEPLLTLSHIAAATQKVRLGIAVLILIWRDPVLAAKQMATLDVFSGGRFMLGVGLGARSEFEAINPRGSKSHRGRMLDEQLQILHLLSKDDEVSFKGQYFEFEGLSLHPKPLQRPIPIYMTTNTPESLNRIALWGSGCFVNPREQEIQKLLENLRPLLEAQGRAISDIDVASSTTISIARTHQEAQERLQKSKVAERRKDILLGTPAEIAEVIGRLKEAGLNNCTLQRFAANTFDELLEQAQMFGEEVMPLVK